MPAGDKGTEVVVLVVHLQAHLAKLSADLQDPWHLVSAALRDLDRFIGGEGEFEDHAHELRGQFVQGRFFIILGTLDDGIGGCGFEVEGAASLSGVCRHPPARFGRHDEDGVAVLSRFASIFDQEEQI